MATFRACACAHRCARSHVWSQRTDATDVELKKDCNKKANPTLDAGVAPFASLENPNKFDPESHSKPSHARTMREEGRPCLHVY